MDALEIIRGHRVQYDASGVGHAWSAVDADNMPGSIMEEIAAWIIEEDPDPGVEMVGSNGQHYRIPPTE